MQIMMKNNVLNLNLLRKKKQDTLIITVTKFLFLKKKLYKYIINNYKHIHY